jgi:hypothetical protein
MTRCRRRIAVSLSVGVALTGFSPAFAQSQSPIDRLAWLHGCWQTTGSPSLVEEQWMAPRGGTMIGMGRTVRDGRTTEYELVVLKEQDGRLAYEAHPSGQPAAVFLSREISDTSVVFENAQHDFPQRVGYRRSESGLAAWIEGTLKGQMRRVDFNYVRVSCGGH